MCKSTAEGGKRCFTHTYDKLVKTQHRLNKLDASLDKTDTQVKWAERAPNLIAEQRHEVEVVMASSSAFYREKVSARQEDLRAKPKRTEQEEAELYVLQTLTDRTKLWEQDPDTFQQVKADALASEHAAAYLKKEGRASSSSDTQGVPSFLNTKALSPEMRKVLEGTSPATASTPSSEFAALQNKSSLTGDMARVADDSKTPSNAHEEVRMWERVRTLRQKQDKRLGLTPEEETHYKDAKTRAAAEPVPEYRLTEANALPSLGQMPTYSENPDLLKGLPRS